MDAPMLSGGCDSEEGWVGTHAGQSSPATLFFAVLNLMPLFERSKTSNLGADVHKCLQNDTESHPKRCQKNKLDIYSRKKCRR